MVGGWCLVSEDLSGWWRTMMDWGFLRGRELTLFKQGKKERNKEIAAEVSLEGALEYLRTAREERTDGIKLDTRLLLNLQRFSTGRHTLLPLVVCILHPRSYVGAIRSFCLDLMFFFFCEHVKVIEAV